jgi:hypothetical protein
MNRFFRTTPEQYETIRSAMDSASGFPNDQAESWFCSAAEAPKDSEGNCLIAAMPAIAEEFIKAEAEELTEEQFNQLTNISEE